MQDKFVYGFRLYTYAILCYKHVTDKMHESLGFENSQNPAKDMTSEASLKELVDTVLKSAEEAHTYFRASID
jgi:hypothetical protein